MKKYNPPLYDSGDTAICHVFTHNQLTSDAVEVLIVNVDQWLLSDKCYLYKAISKRTNQVVWVKETDLTKKEA